ncbi:hypothetical protein FA95DRAFT_562977 [Auriscalpium vulgare]|uniref:Uncharacterized protein n=1 Tax=Auriscalpium vulgare TaxID=40419 RepID=A0ACB8RF50_9AGAM|nr:hypothetical protein FA95DRAFT_562977 [Auriscalpium vulgare]
MNAGHVGDATSDTGVRRLANEMECWRGVEAGRMKRLKEREDGKSVTCVRSSSSHADNGAVSGADNDIGTNGTRLGFSVDSAEITDGVGVDGDHARDKGQCCRIQDRGFVEDVQSRSKFRSLRSKDLGCRAPRPSRSSVRRHEDARRGVKLESRQRIELMSIGVQGGPGRSFLAEGHEGRREVGFGWEVGDRRSGSWHKGRGIHIEDRQRDDSRSSDRLGGVEMEVRARERRIQLWRRLG